MFQGGNFLERKLFQDLVWNPPSQDLVEFRVKLRKEGGMMKRDPKETTVKNAFSLHHDPSILLHVL